MKKFVIGDIHGRLHALQQVLTRAKFNYDKDLLILLGDIVDGGFNTYEVVEELLKIKNKILILGNHDEWFIQHYTDGFNGSEWLNQGGANTKASYKDTIPISHKKFFACAKHYHIEDGKLFVHGGFDELVGVELTDKECLLWDRNLIDVAASRPILQHNQVREWKKIFVGHTTTERTDGVMHPVLKNNLWMMDCGAGWTGKLAVMDIDSEEYWLSDKQDPARPSLAHMDEDALFERFKHLLD